MSDTLTNGARLELMMDFEEGQLDSEHVVLLFQDLIDSGLAWSLQGAYGRTAASLIEAGLCEAPS